MISQHIQERLADGAVAGSFIGWLASIAIDTLPIVQWFAGMAAAVAAICAAYYHIKKARK